MQRKTRQTLFWSFFVVFVVIGPAILLYARGYRFDFVKRKFVATGALFIKSDPPGAAIYVNGIKKGETSGTLKDALTKSSLIANILPGEYDIRVEKPEYRPWVKKLIIRPRQVTEARAVYLLPEYNTPKALYFGEIRDAVMAPDGKSAAVVSERAATTSITLIDTETKEWKVLYTQKRDEQGKRSSAKKPDAARQDIVPPALSLRGFSDNSRFLLAGRLQKNILPSFVILDKEKPNTIAHQLTPSSTNFTNDLAIHNDRAIFTDPQNRLWEWRFSSKSGGQTLATLSTSSWGVTERAGRFYSIAGSPPMLYIAGSDGKNRTQLTNTAILEKGEPLAMHVEQLSAGDLAVLAIPKDTGEGDVLRISSDGTILKLQEHVRDIELAPDGKKLLMRTWNELWILYVDDVLTQPVHKKDDRVLAARFGIAVKDARWLGSDYLLYTIPEGLFAIELDDRGTVRNNLDIIRNGDITLKAITRDAIYFTAQNRLQKFSLKPDPKNNNQ